MCILICNVWESIKATIFITTVHYNRSLLYKIQSLKKMVQLENTSSHKEPNDASLRYLLITSCYWAPSGFPRHYPRGLRRASQNHAQNYFIILSQIRLCYDAYWKLDKKPPFIMLSTISLFPWTWTPPSICPPNRSTVFVVNQIIKAGTIIFVLSCHSTNTQLDSSPWESLCIKDRQLKNVIKFQAQVNPHSSIKCKPSKSI